MNGPRVRRAGQEVDGLGMLGIPHVYHGDAHAEGIADIGVAAVHHDLDTVGVPALVGMTDEFNVSRGVRLHGASLHSSFGSFATGLGLTSGRARAGGHGLAERVA